MKTRTMKSPSDARVDMLEHAVIELLDRLQAAEMMITALNREQAKAICRPEQERRVQ